MDYQALGKHAFDILKGAVGAAVMAATLGFLQYLGAHIPEIIQAIATMGAGAAAVKTHIS